MILLRKGESVTRLLVDWLVQSRPEHFVQYRVQLRCWLGGSFRLSEPGESRTRAFLLDNGIFGRA